MENVEKPGTATLATQTQVETGEGEDTGSKCTKDTSSDNVTPERRVLPPRRQYRNQAELMPQPAPVPPNVEKVKSEPAQPCNVQPEPIRTGLYQTNCGQHFVLTPGGPIQVPHEDVPSMQSVTMPSSQKAQSPPGILQYSGLSGGGAQQYYISGNNEKMMPAATGDMSVYQLHNPTSSLPQGVMLANAHGPQKPAEDSMRKRELRLMKNREAARSCRRRKKEYFILLETRVAVLESENEKMKARLQYFQDVYGEQLGQDTRQPA